MTRSLPGRVLAAVAATFILFVAAADDVEVQPPADTGGDNPFVGWFKSYARCRADYEELDARIDRAGVRDAESYRVPGFPYLRSDRVLASYRHDVQGLNDVSEWVRLMRERDQDAREVELANLGLDEFEVATQRDHFLNCGRVLAAIELEDASNWASMIERVQPKPLPGESSTEASPETTAMPRSALRREYLKPLTPPNAGASMVRWTAAPTEDLALLKNLDQRVQVNTLGFPLLAVSEWSALAETLAPQLWIETGNDDDVPASPVPSANGSGADATRQDVFYEYGFARFGGHMLAQINYFVWFKSDAQAGSAALDGFIWRVTLDEQMKPLIYESVRASGRDHRWYLARPLKERDSLDSEASFVAPNLVPAHDAVLRVRAKSHDVVRLVSGDQAVSTSTRHYTLRPYENLLKLPQSDGSTRSLFGPDGAVVGSAGTRNVLWQFGHHAIDRAHGIYLDDPYLLESIFVAPSPDSKPDQATR